jgi:hypothetical protein
MKTQKQDLKEPLQSDLFSESLVGGSTIRLELKNVYEVVGTGPAFPVS